MWPFSKGATKQEEPDTHSPKSNGSGMEVVEIEDTFDVDDFEMITTGEELADINKKLREQAEEVATLRATVNRLTSKAQSDNSLRKKEIECKERILAKKEQEVTEIRQKVKGAERKNQTLATDLSQRNKAVEQLHNDVEALRKENLALQKDLVQCQKQLQSLAEDIQQEEQGHKATLDTKQAEILKMKEALDHIDDQLREQTRLTREREATVAALTASRSDDVITEAKLAATTNQVESLKEETQALRSEKKELTHAIRQEKVHTEALGEDMHREMEHLNGRIKQAEKDKLTADKDTERAKKEVTMLQSRLQKGTTSAQDLNKQVQQAGEEYTSLKAQARATDTRLSDEIDGVEYELAGLQKNIQDCEKQLKQSQRERKKREAEIAQLNKDLEANRERMAEMQLNIDAITAQADNKPVVENTKVNEVNRIMRENPESVPIRCMRAPECKDYPLLERKKFAAPKDMTLSRFNNHIRSKLNLKDDDSLSVYVKWDGPMPATEVLDELHKQCKQSDGFLWLLYSRG